MFPSTGGGFGSKLDLTVQGFIGLALYHFQRPVRLAFSREEAFLATPKRHPLTIDLETGATKDGRIQALRARFVCDTGAYASYSLAVATRSALHITGPYEIDNVDVESLCVYTNHPIAGAMRGFGVPQVAFAHESQMNVLAEKLGLDPLEIRRTNALRVGSRTGTGQELKASVGIIKTLAGCFQAAGGTITAFTFDVTGSVPYAVSATPTASAVNAGQPSRAAVTLTGPGGTVYFVDSMGGVEGAPSGVLGAGRYAINGVTSSNPRMGLIEEGKTGASAQSNVAFSITLGGP